MGGRCPQRPFLRALGRQPRAASPAACAAEEGAVERRGDAERLVDDDREDQDDQEHRPEVLFRDPRDPPREGERQQDVDQSEAPDPPAVDPFAGLAEGVAVNPGADWAADPDALVVPDAGEVLYRLRP